MYCVYRVVSEPWVAYDPTISICYNVRPVFSSTNRKSQYSGYCYQSFPSNFSHSLPRSHTTHFGAFLLQESLFQRLVPLRHSVLNPAVVILWVYRQNRSHAAEFANFLGALSCTRHRHRQHNISHHCSFNPDHDTIL